MSLFSLMVPEKQLAGATSDGTAASSRDGPLGVQGDNLFILIVSKCAMTAGRSQCELAITHDYRVALCLLSSSEP